VGKPEGRRASGRLGVSWEEHFKMDIKEVRWGVDFIKLAVGNVRLLTLVKTVVTFQVPRNMGSFWTPISGVSLLHIITEELFCFLLQTFWIIFSGD
jgi:hypothetical protein